MVNGTSLGDLEFQLMLPLSFENKTNCTGSFAKETFLCSVYSTDNLMNVFVWFVAA